MSTEDEPQHGHGLGDAASALEEALGHLPLRQALHLPRWLGPFAICFMAGFLPWIVYLSLTIPSRSHTSHYDVAWIGFDCAMWVVIGLLAFCAFTGRAATGPFAAVAATMLMLDGWFDVTTSQSGGGFVEALILALCAELPLAIICGWAAVNAEMVRARAHRQLRSRWLAALEVARQADQRARLSVRESPL
jgi:hypothetical protein